MGVPDPPARRMNMGEAKQAVMAVVGYPSLAMVTLHTASHMQFPQASTVAPSSARGMRSSWPTARTRPTCAAVAGAPASGSGE